MKVCARVQVYVRDSKIGRSSTTQKDENEQKKKEGNGKDDEGSDN
jgi:hypothetical protein